LIFFEKTNGITLLRLFEMNYALEFLYKKDK
jgi:hypothetical protein